MNRWGNETRAVPFSRQTSISKVIIHLNQNLVLKMLIFNLIRDSPLFFFFFPQINYLFNTMPFFSSLLATPLLFSFQTTLFSFFKSLHMSSSGNVRHLSQTCINGRKSWFMKWASKLLKGGSVNGGSPAPQFIPVRSLDNHSRSDKEKEELDRAIALSLAEGLKKPNGYGWQPSNNEDLPSYPSHVPCEYNPLGYRRCGGCNRNIGGNHSLGRMGTFFHPECFRCHACGHPITEHEFSSSGNNSYHKSCFQELTHPKCEVCFQFIPRDEDGEIVYGRVPFWSQKFCPAHLNDNTALCCSCERFEVVNVGNICLGDGRSLCLECMESSIMDTGECQPLYHSIRDYYEGLNMRLDQQIPMLLVERHALNDAIFRDKNGLYLPEIKGICLSEELTVASIIKRPRICGTRFVGMITRRRKLIHRCEVTAILVLYGLPRLRTGAILAHELMHAWLRLNGYGDLNPEVMEGICQVLAYMWLESEIMPGLPSSSSSVSKKGGKSRFENKLGEYLMHQIANDKTPVYGGGFRAANAAVNTYGLRRTLDHIRHTGTFPQ